MAYRASSPYTYNPPGYGYIRIDPFAPPAKTPVRIYVTSDGYFAGEEVAVYINGNFSGIFTTDSYGNVTANIIPQDGLYAGLGIAYNMAVIGKTSGVTNSSSFSLG